MGQTPIRPTADLANRTARATIGPITKDFDDRLTA